MKEYKVIKKEGIRTVAGDLVKKGKTFQASPRSATTQLLLRCKEIEPVESEPDSTKEVSKPPTAKEITAILEKRKVRIPEGAKKADLEKLLADSEPDQS